LIAAELNHAKKRGIGLLCLNVMCWVHQKQKYLMDICKIQRHCLLRYKIFKDALFFEHLDLSIIRLAPLLKSQQFVSVTVVRKSLLALR